MGEVLLRENVEQCSLKLDKDAGLISGVKVLGFQSLNRRRYTTEAVQKALPLYENIKVNLDHPGDPSESRSLRDRIGKLINVRMSDNGLWGDLLYNPAHPMAEAVVWWAENQPDCLGLSHNAVGEGYEDDDGVFHIERICSVRSVDLVAEPATTKGLYEHKEIMDDELQPQDQDLGQAPDSQGEEDYEAHIGHLIVSVLKDEELSLEEKKKKVLQALKLMDDEEAGEETEGEAEEAQDEDREEEDEECKMECIQALRTSGDMHVKALLKSHNRLARENKARKMCEAARIPASEVFIEALIQAKSEGGMKALIEDRKAITNRPRSTGRVAERLTAEDFARQIME